MNLQKKTRNNGCAYNLSMKKTLLFYFCAVRKHLLVPFFKYLPEIPINNRNTHKFEIVSYTYIMAHNISFICREKQSPLLLRALLVLYNESIEKKHKKQWIYIQSVHEKDSFVLFCVVRKHLLVTFFQVFARNHN